MKILALVLVSLMTGIANASNVYYCSDQESVGINPKTLEPSGFTDERFKISVDWQNRSVLSNDIGLGNVWQKTCFLHKGDQVGTNLNCMSEAGISFSLNRETLKYNRSFIYNTHFANGNDRLTISTGSCEQF